MLSCSGRGRSTYLQGSVELAVGNGVRTAAVVYEDSQFPTSVAEGIREAVLDHGMELVIDRSYAADGADHEALVTAAMDAGVADAEVCWGR